MNLPEHITAADNSTVKDAVEKGITFLADLQNDDGSWSGDYGGPLFLLPMYIGACYITGEEISDKEREGFSRYFFNVQNEDGSMGLHVEDEGCMFTSVLTYVSLRFMGHGPDEKEMKKMLSWILSSGGAVGSASWGKFFLALLNLYPYEGLNPLLPELWSMPYGVPFHPGRLWCHARQVYLPMAYLYGIKASIPGDSLIEEIRSEIYDGCYNDITFRKHRNTLADADNYNPYTAVFKLANRAMSLFEKMHSKKLRKRSLENLFAHILYEDESTRYIDIGPINSILNTIVHFYRDREGEHYHKSFRALKTYLFEGHDGIKMNGYNSTALWDTAFAVQSICATGLQGDIEQCLGRAHDFIRNNQIVDELEDYESYFRNRTRGGWPFSDREHGWPITDCTAEGYKSATLLEKNFKFPNPVPAGLLDDSVNIMLEFQNKDGGWATYERCRGGKWLELMNPSSVFGDIMIDYSYVECTSSCLQALSAARHMYSGSKLKRIEKAMERGGQYLAGMQREDGSFEGSWAVCFTYGTWFGVWGLLAAGAAPGTQFIERACNFLKDRQNSDGGWGESYRSCKERRWVNHEESQVVQTSWALMTLVKSGMAHSESANRAAAFIVKRQMDNGDWPRESLVGVFNKTTLINYENYRRYFPVWALGLYMNA